MYWRLSEKVFWGDINSIKETREVVKSTIGLCDNNELKTYKFSPFSVLPYTNPYFWHPIPDEGIPNTDFINLLLTVVGSYIKQQRFPILVHCYAGQHRSTITAIFTEMLLSGFNQENFDLLKNKIKSLQPLYHEREYSLALQEYIKAMIANDYKLS